MRQFSPSTMAVACALSGAILAAAVAFWIPNQYVSSAVLRMGPANTPTGKELHAAVLQRVMSRTVLDGVIRKNDLYAGDRLRIPLEEVIDGMRSNIRITPMFDMRGEGKRTVYAVQFTDPDPVRARSTMADLVNRIAESNAVEAAARVKQGVSPSELAASIVEVIDPPNLPHRPLYPNRLAITAAGLIGGLVLGVAASIAMRRRRIAA